MGETGKKLKSQDPSANNKKKKTSEMSIAYMAQRYINCEETRY